MQTKRFGQMFHDSHSWKKKIVFGNVQVTTELAKDLLRLNVKNRPINNATVDLYADQMSKGQWVDNGDNIRISKTGALLDSQHRLMAVLKSGVTINQNIVCGLDDEVFDKIDIGRQRSAADTIAVAGYKNYTTVAGATKLIMAYKGGVLKQASGSGGGGRVKYTNHEVREYLETRLDKDMMEECASIGNRCVHKAKFLSPSTYTAFTYLFSELDRDAAILFMEMLVGGENISKDSYSMVYLLRSKLINYQISNTSLHTMDKYALVIKAWNAFRKSKEIKQLSWQQSEDFPVIQ